MSNFDELVRSEAARKQEFDWAEEERTKRAGLLAGLDTGPGDVLPAPDAPCDGRGAGAAKAKRDGYVATATAGVIQGTSSSSSSGLIRGNSSLTPLEDAGLIEETGIAMSMCGFGKPTGEGISQQLFALAGLHAPSEESF